MNTCIEMVRQFHIKHRLPIGIKPGNDPQTDLIRVSLIAEEGVAELALAIAERNITKIADSLGDLAYVLFGAAITYGIPLKEVFEEIHRSNMTKAARVDEDPRLRNKSEAWVPPDIVGILARFEHLVASCGDPH